MFVRRPSFSLGGQPSFWDKAGSLFLFRCRLSIYLRLQDGQTHLTSDSSEVPPPRPPGRRVCLVRRSPSLSPGGQA